MLNFLFLIARAAEVVIKPGEINPNIPGVTGGGPLEIIGGFYKFALGISGFLALAVIIYGAIKYATNAGNAGNLTDAKEWIYSALLGILLLSGAYILLNTIGGTQLTNLQLPTLNKIQVSSSSPGPRPLTPGTGIGQYGFEGHQVAVGTYSDVDARAKLRAAGISVNKSNCTAPPEKNTCDVEDPATGKFYPSCTDCTSLTMIPEGAISELIEFKKNCDQKVGGGCDVVVTGGTEAGHATHRTGRAILDISYRPSVTSYITLLLGEFAGTRITPCVPHRGQDGNSYMLEDQSCPWKPIAHWHIVF